MNTTNKIAIDFVVESDHTFTFTIHLPFTTLKTNNLLLSGAVNWPAVIDTIHRGIVSLLANINTSDIVEFLDANADEKNNLSLYSLGLKLYYYCGLSYEEDFGSGASDKLAELKTKVLHAIDQRERMEQFIDENYIIGIYKSTYSFLNVKDTPDTDNIYSLETTTLGGKRLLLNNTSKRGVVIRDRRRYYIILIILFIKVAIMVLIVVWLIRKMYTIFKNYYRQEIK